MNHFLSKRIIADLNELNLVHKSNYWWEKVSFKVIDYNDGKTFIMSVYVFMFRCSVCVCACVCVLGHNQFKSI